MRPPLSSRAPKLSTCLTIDRSNSIRDSHQDSAMGNVICFPGKSSNLANELEIDLLTAVDVAIRDLREISENSSGSIRAQGRECLLMLETAFAAARGPTSQVERS